MVRLSICEEISLAKYGIQVNVNARTCTARTAAEKIPAPSLKRERAGYFKLKPETHLGRNHSNKLLRFASHLIVPVDECS
jgi:hypothetical protein